MKEYPLSRPHIYQHYVKIYREAMAEGQEEDLFLGVDPKCRINERGSYELELTDISVLIKYCLFPIYSEGDSTIANRTFNILKKFALSGDVLKLYQTIRYLYIQDYVLEEYHPLPFMLHSHELVPAIFEGISILTDTQKNTKRYRSICSILEFLPIFKQYDEALATKILEDNEVRKKQISFEKSVSEVYPIVLDTTSVDAIGIVDGHLELLLVDDNPWYSYVEHDHLLKLQEKINNYIHYLESKQYVGQYGDTFDKKVINITFKYSPSDNGLAFLVQVQKALQHTDMSLKVVFPN